jgi:hypothetical protein
MHYKLMTEAYHRTLAKLYETHAHLNYINMTALHPTGMIWCYRVREGDTRSFFSINIHGEVKFATHDVLSREFLK